MKAGKIQISEELLLKWLDFYPEGKIRGTNFLADYYPPVLEVIIEHPELPEIRKGEAIRDISVGYITTTDASGHSATVRKKKHFLTR